MKSSFLLSRNLESGIRKSNNSLLSARHSDRKEKTKKELIKPKNHPNTEILLSKDFPQLGSPSKFLRKTLINQKTSQNSQKSKFYRKKIVSKSVNLKPKQNFYCKKRGSRKENKFMKLKKLDLRNVSNPKSRVRKSGKRRIYRDSSVPYLNLISVESQVIHSQVFNRNRFKSIIYFI